MSSRDPFLSSHWVRRALTVLKKVAVERVLLDPRYKDILGVVKGARNGAVYGTKIRFPHALV